MKHRFVTVGGTFDYLHRGHRLLLEKAFEAGEKVFLGITSNHMCQVSSVKCQVKSYSDRKKETDNYLKDKGWLNRVEVLLIEDKYGSTLTDQKVQVIVVSPETEKTALEINQLRVQKGWPQLEIITVPWVLADDGKPINSVRIRNGEIDREGKLFSLPDDWGVRHLPDKLRETFKKPLGKLITSISDLGNLSHLNSLLITIGDATTANLLKSGITPDISIVDLKIHRVSIYKNVLDLGFRNIKVLKKAENPAGTITYESYISLIRLIRPISLIQRPSVLQIDGEDDLLTLLAIFLAPLGSLIVYGQPNQGVVVVEVTEAKKQAAGKYLETFER